MKTQFEYFRHIASLKHRGELDPREHALLSVIAGYSLGDAPCTFVDLKQSTECSERQLYRDLSRLEEMELLVRQRGRNGMRYLPAMCVSTDPGGNKHTTKDAPQTKQPKARTKAAQEDRVAVKVPKVWAQNLTPKQRAQLSNFTVRESRKRRVELLFQRYTPYDMAPGIFKKVQEATDPIAYLASLPTSSGSLPAHCLFSKAEKPEPVGPDPHRQKRKPPPAPEPVEPRVLTPEEQAECNRRAIEEFAKARRLLEETPDENLRTTLKRRSTS